MNRAVLLQVLDPGTGEKTPLAARLQGGATTAADLRHDILNNNIIDNKLISKMDNSPGTKVLFESSPPTAGHLAVASTCT